MSGVIRVTMFNDPVCPWGYSASPQFRVLEWRYGSALVWRLVLIGLREDAGELLARGYSPARSAAGYAVFRKKYGMPFSTTPKARLVASGRACRAVVSARLLDPGSEWTVLRALQLAHFTTPLLLDDDDQLRDALGYVSSLDADAIVDGIDDPAVEDAYQRDRAEARTAAGTPIAMQGKAASSGGAVRFTAPSLVFERDGRRLDAGGWQPSLSYDTCVANLDATLERRPAPETALPLLDAFPEGLTTAEIAMLLASGPDEVSHPDAAEAALVQLAGDGLVVREPVGHDAVWRRGDAVASPPGADAAAVRA
jgi:protein-disulfide isomerase-like protein with CxxC motif